MYSENIKTRTGGHMEFITVVALVKEGGEKIWYKNMGI